MTTIRYYFSVLSPWSYLAGTRLEDLAHRIGADILYKPFDILALYTRIGAPAPGERPVGREVYRAQELQRWSARLGMQLNLKPAHWPTNAAPASYALIAAQQAGGGDLGALTHSLLRAVWAEERDIARDDVIEDCLDAAGFSRSLTLSGLVTGAETYARNLEEAVSDGVFGAPFYITADDARFWGQDRLDMLEEHLERSA